MTRAPVSQTHSFEYPGGSGELSRVVLPYGGALRWTHRDFTFVGNKTIREVQNRYLTKQSGFPEQLYSIWRNDAADANNNLHVVSSMTDPTGASKAWTLMDQPGQWSNGLLNWFYEYGTGQVDLRHHEFTWALSSSGNPYVGTVKTTLNAGTAYAKTSKTEQTVDAYGNVTQTKIYDFTDLVNPARTYNNTYLTDGNYASRNIRNRLVSSTVTKGGQTVVLTSNLYDNFGLGPAILSPAPRQHDTANYGGSFAYRGNISTNVTPEGVTSFSRSITGDVYSGGGPGGSFSGTPTSATNYAAPSVITSNNLSTSLTYTGFLGVSSATGQNTEVATTYYDSAARPSQTFSPHGAVTTYSYGQVSQVTTNGRWTRTTADGLGRPILVETGDGGTTRSIVETEYDSCACSPLGKMKRFTQPYAPGGTKYWTTYTYDGLGRALSVQSPDGASTTTYAYQGNTTIITDPAGKWKKYVTDAMNNLIRVSEPGN